MRLTTGPHQSKSPPVGRNGIGSTREATGCSTTRYVIAIVQLRQPHTPGRVIYERKLAEGKTKKEAIRALKRRLSDVVYHRLVEDNNR